MDESHRAGNRSVGAFLLILLSLSLMNAPDSWPATMESLAERLISRDGTMDGPTDKQWGQTTTWGVALLHRFTDAPRDVFDQ